VKNSRAKTWVWVKIEWKGQKSEKIKFHLFRFMNAFVLLLFCFASILFASVLFVLIVCFAFVLLQF